MGQVSQLPIKYQEKEEKKPIEISRDINKYPMLFWLKATEEEVANKFLSLSGAVSFGEKTSRYVWVPGKRQNKVVLVAHGDTVWHDSQDLDPVFGDGKYFSNNPEKGIGADDRAGCHMMWELKDLGHSILLTFGEECGLVGARNLMNNNNEIAKEIEGHQFAIEMDRMNNNDMAFYDVGIDTNNQFKNWCEKQFEGYKRVWGSSTDICTLCRKICGMNISIGYYGQHSSHEHVKLSEWLHTLETMKRVLSAEELPKFIRSETPYSYHGRYDQHSYGYSDDYAYANYQRKQSAASTYNRVEIKPIKDNYLEEIIICPNCEMAMGDWEYDRNNKKCVNTKCQKEF